MEESKKEKKEKAKRERKEYKEVASNFLYSNYKNQYKMTSYYMVEIKNLSFSIAYFF